MLTENAMRSVRVPKGGLEGDGAGAVTAAVRFDQEEVAGTSVEQRLEVIVVHSTVSIDGQPHPLAATATGPPKRDRLAHTPGWSGRD